MTRFPDLDWLFTIEQFGIKFGLDNIKTLVEALGHPERTFRSVHVAGTNGKGSVTAMVDAAVRAAGHRAGRYTSPHLLDLTERFAIDGRPVASEALASAVADVRQTIGRLMAAGRLDVHPTFFEVTTAVAFELFRRAEVEIAICEVGLGGRLDATNVLAPEVTAITSIGFDHEQYLGHTLAEIAAEKGGIIKPGVPVVAGRMGQEPLAAIESIARDRQAPLIYAPREVEVTRVPPQAGQEERVRLRTKERDYGVLAPALRGTHQVENMLVAVRVLETLGSRGIDVPPSAIVQGLTRVEWPGRLDLRRLPDGREMLLDAAHNPEGAAALASFLASSSRARPPLVFGAMRDKDVRSMIERLAPCISALVVTRVSNPRASDPSDLAALARQVDPALPVLAEPSLRNALDAAWRLSPHIVVAGSIFLLGDVLSELGPS